jgi:hypothetical protein
LDVCFVNAMLEDATSLGAGTLAATTSAIQGVQVIAPEDMAAGAIASWWTLSLSRVVLESMGSLPSIGLHFGFRSLLGRFLTVRSELPMYLVPMATWTSAIAAATGFAQVTACAIDAYKGRLRRRRSVVEEEEADARVVLHEDEPAPTTEDGSPSLVLLNHESVAVSVQWEETEAGGADEEGSEWQPPPLAVRVTWALRSIESGLLALAASRAFFTGARFPQLPASWFALRYGIVVGQLRRLNNIGIPFRSTLFTCRAERMFAVFMLSWTALDVWRRLHPRRPRRGRAPQHPTNWLPGTGDGSAMSTVTSTFNSLTSSADTLPPPVESRPESPAPGADASLRCVICMGEPRCVLLRPCNHLALCLECAREMTRRSEANPGAPQFRECPLCRKQVKSVVKVFV